VWEDYVRDNLAVEDSVEMYRNNLPQHIERLNKLEYLEGGEVPIAVVLKNAVLTYKPAGLAEARFFKKLLDNCRTKAQQQIDQTTDDAEKQSWTQARDFIDGQIRDANRVPIQQLGKALIRMSPFLSLAFALGILIAYSFLSLAVSRNWSLPLLRTNTPTPTSPPTATPLEPELIFRRPEKDLYWIIPATPTVREYQVKPDQWICAGFRPRVDKPINDLEWDNPQELEISPAAPTGVPATPEGACQWWVRVPIDAAPRYRISVLDPANRRTLLGAAVLVVAKPAATPIGAPTAE
jgi:hypothetical protein